MSRIRKLADPVANIPMKPPAPSAQTRGTWNSRLRALELLAKSSDGCTEAMLLAQGFDPDVLAGLIRIGLADLHVGRVRAGAEQIDVRNLRIHGRWPPSDRPTLMD